MEIKFFLTVGEILMDQHETNSDLCWAQRRDCRPDVSTPACTCTGNTAQRENTSQSNMEDTLTQFINQRVLLLKAEGGGPGQELIQLALLHLITPLLFCSVHHFLG